MKSKAKRVLSLFLAASMVISMSACGGTGSETKVESNDTTVTTTPGGKVAATKQINIEINGDPNTLAPYASSSSPRNRTIIYTIYEPLFHRLQFGGELTPCVGKSWKQIDATTYEVEIYDYVKDSAGNPITADDVVFSYQTAIDSGTQTGYVGSVTEIKKTGDYTVQISLASEEVGVFSDSVNFVPIISKAAWDASTDEMIANPVGTGPYVLDNWTTGSSLTLVKNENYWQDPAVSGERQAVDKVVFKEITEAAQITVALETGDVDFAYDVQSSDLFHFKEGGDDEGFTTYRFLNILMQCIFFNCDESSVCADPKVRQAICYAIDNQAILSNIYNGEGELSTTFSNSLYADYQDSWKNLDYYSYNVEKAKELLAEAGHPDGITIRLLTNSSADHKRIAEIIQALLAEANIKVDITNYEAALFNTYVSDPKEFDAYVTQKAAGGLSVLIWKLSLDARMFNGVTKNFLKNDEFQKLLETALNSATNSPETVDSVRAWLDENVPIYAFCSGYKYYVHTDDLLTPCVSGETVFYPGMSEFADTWHRTVE